LTLFLHFVEFVGGREEDNHSIMTERKKNRPPKGFAQLPEWWLEITPHNTLDVDEDTKQRNHDYQQAMKYAELAAKADWEQQFGHLELTEDGNLFDKNTGELVEEGEATGYTRDDKGGWMKDGKPIFGRQFKAGEGSYDPSKFAACVHRDSTELKAAGAEYGHKDMNWKKPDWMKVSRRFLWDDLAPCLFLSLFSSLCCSILVGETQENGEACLVGSRRGRSGRGTCRAVRMTNTCQSRQFAIPNHSTRRHVVK
jgi:hypothetical protein